MNIIKNIILVHIGDILLCPPALSVVDLLARQGYRVTVITTDDHSTRDYVATFPEGVEIQTLDFADPLKTSLIPKTFNMLVSRKRIWELIDGRYSASDSLVWVSSLVTLKYLVPTILKYNYVLHVMELAERICYTEKLPLLEIDAEVVGNAALAVVVPESVRAHITQAWWNLNRLPLVLPNKPVMNGSNARRQAASDPAAAKVLEPLRDKKIVLYQGIVHKERPLKPYLEAVEELGGGFVFVTMGSKDPLEGVVSPQYAHIPYVPAPKHLEVTSGAYIGVLSYFPFKGHSSVLNPLFCAPNKTFEYARFGVPMLGNDNPNLNYVFEKWGCGVSVKEFKGGPVASAIKEIDDNYKRMSVASREYYDSVDMIKLINNIMSTIDKRKCSIK